LISAARVAWSTPTLVSPPEDFLFHFEGLDAAARIIDRGGHGMLADGDAGAGGINETDGLVRQLARGDVAVGEPDGGFDGFIQDLHAVMFLERRHDVAQHQDGPLLPKAPQP